MTNKEKASIGFGLAALLLFGVHLWTGGTEWAVLSIFYAITSSEYKIRADIEKERE